MFSPSLHDVLSLAARYTMIPIRVTMLADRETPIRLYQKLRRPDSFLLESVEGGAHWARYSFIGLRPFLTLEAKGERVTVTRRDGRITEQTGNPLDILRELTDQYRSPKLPGFPRLTGGAVGFFGYHTLSYVEDLPPHPRAALGVPDLRVHLVDEVIAFDHLKQEIQVIVNLRVDEGDTPDSIADKYRSVCGRLRDLARLASAEPSAGAGAEASAGLPMWPQGEPAPLAVRSNLDRDSFCRMVERAKEYIAAGDIFQVVLSQRFSVRTDVDPFAAYRVLRTLNPSPYMYFFQYRDMAIAGASPELLVRVEDGAVEIRPIAGTRRRGSTPDEDQALAEELLADPKERAEHFMLVDLARNDVGRVAAFGSVRVEELLAIERYSHVMHLVSHVKGRLREGLHPFDALLAAFPAGTLSGAPKLRAMEIIAELEPDARHLYGGAIGYLSFTGNLDTCITIRTMLFVDGEAHVQAGGGVVADSRPDGEYQESVNKAAALLRALEVAHQLFGVEEEERSCLPQS